MGSRPSRLAFAVAAGGTLLTGCSGGGPHSTLAPAGKQAQHIDSLWWLLFWVSCVVFVIVIAAMVIAFFREHEAPDKSELPDSARHHLFRGIGIVVGITVVTLLVLFIATVVTDRRLAEIETHPDALTIAITGKQWWWDVVYEDKNPSLTIRTANEIHVPVGRPVRLKLTSADVIHSFWVPALHGKRDLIPGHENQLWIQADRAGVFEGHCAEFCGHQHAHMRILVVAQPPEEFEEWLQGQRRPSREPANEAEARGREVFLTSTCIMCHSIRGTIAGSRLGPDLTHLASRRTLAAASIPNTRGHLAGWILDPQGIKPGNRMPPHNFPAEQLHPLLDYLRSLE